MRSYGVARIVSLLLIPAFLANTVSALPLQPSRTFVVNSVITQQALSPAHVGFTHPDFIKRVTAKIIRAAALLSLGSVSLVLNAQPSSIQVQQVNRLFQTAIQQDRDLTPREEKFILDHLSDPLVEDDLYKKFSEPLDGQHPSATPLVRQIIQHRYNPSRVPQLVQVMEQPVFGFPAIYRRLDARLTLIEWAKSFPEDVNYHIQTSGLIPQPEKVLPAERGNRHKVGILLVDTTETTHEDLMARVINARLNNPNRISIQRVALNQNKIKAIVEENPDTTFILAMSFGGDDNDPLAVGGFFGTAWVKEMGAKGVLFVFASGNSGIYTPWVHPALDNVLYVAAAEKSGLQKTSYSNFAAPSYLFMSAPEPVLPGVDPKRTKGTSFSGPQVAAELANVLDENPRLPDATAIENVGRHAKPMLDDRFFKAGLLGKGLLSHEPSKYYKGIPKPFIFVALPFLFLIVSIGILFILIRHRVPRAVALLFLAGTLGWGQLLQDVVPQRESPILLGRSAAIHIPKMRSGERENVYERVFHSEKELPWIMGQTLELAVTPAHLEQLRAIHISIDIANVSLGFNVLKKGGSWIIYAPGTPVETLSLKVDPVTKRVMLQIVSQRNTAVRRAAVVVEYEPPLDRQNEDIVTLQALTPKKPNKTAQADSRPFLLAA